mmetsp:Transcript_107986/g.344754  ORF Transcript_107986/g.344754 Transcript_107986/m.344754 type:complete len:293 (+) Transcript_107986:3595-4473(+)
MWQADAHKGRLRLQQCLHDAELLQGPRQIAPVLAHVPLHGDDSLDLHARLLHRVFETLALRLQDAVGVAVVVHNVRRRLPCGFAQHGDGRVEGLAHRPGDAEHHGPVLEDGGAGLQRGDEHHAASFAHRGRQSLGIAARPNDKPDSFVFQELQRLVNQVRIRRQHNLEHLNLPYHSTNNEVSSLQELPDNLIHSVAQSFCTLRHAAARLDAGPRPERDHTDPHGLIDVVGSAETVESPQQDAGALCAPRPRRRQQQKQQQRHQQPREGRRPGGRRPTGTAGYCGGLMSTPTW